MGKVTVRPETSRLFLDFRFQGERCREPLGLADNAKNRRIAKKLLAQVEEQIALGAFDYAATFPNSKRAGQFQLPVSPTTAPVSVQQGGAGSSPMASSQPEVQTPLFKDFVETWFAECKPGWRPRYRESVRNALDLHLIPAFANRQMHEIRRADVLAFRAELAEKPGRQSETLSNSRVNTVMTFLRQVLTEASLRYEFPPAFQGIKPLKTGKADVQPFTLAEVNRILEYCREDWRNYFVVRFFTGLRSGEIHGLRWHNVDFDHGLILVRETLVGGEIQKGAKTQESCRDIPMLPSVRDALMAQREATPDHVEWVFYNTDLKPICTSNFVSRIWKPLLGYLRLPYRRPYQTRHTTASLLLAAGENPEWVARVLGHSSTEMLFKVYSRFIPNLTRQDGSAMAAVLASQASPSNNNDKENDG